MKVRLSMLFLVQIAISGLLNCSVSVKDPIQALKVSDILKDTLQLILQEGELATERSGYELAPSAQYFRVTWVIENASTQDLENLVQSDNGMFRAIGFQGLYKRRGVNWYQHLLTILADTTTHVDYTDHCLGETIKVSEFCLRKVIHYKILDPGCGIINPEQRKEIDNLITEHNLNVKIRE